jgi:hypothetical protein
MHWSLNTPSLGIKDHFELLRAVLPHNLVESNQTQLDSHPMPEPPSHLDNTHNNEELYRQQVALMSAAN